jgi:hypothetical protein
MMDVITIVQRVQARSASVKVLDKPAAMTSPIIANTVRGKS